MTDLNLIKFRFNHMRQYLKIVKIYLKPKQLLSKKLNLSD